MSTDAKQVNVHVVHVYGHLAYSLSCIGMEENALFSANLADVFNRLHDPNLVVDKYHRAEESARGNGVL